MKDKKLPLVVKPMRVSWRHGHHRRVRFGRGRGDTRLSMNESWVVAELNSPGIDIDADFDEDEDEEEDAGPQRWHRRPRSPRRLSRRRTSCAGAVDPKVMDAQNEKRLRSNRSLQSVSIEPAAAGLPT
ncbi:hypothetical protein AB4Z40_32795 [Bosea sp. 2YAB26]|uniref:hypothetical protein n=1 Tax=Bosea sp. 2YAB26 TaxID=3237478 RepID=UPI003F932037